jgi:antitoxin HigA-1
MKPLTPSHPGKILLEEFIRPLGLTQYRVAKDAGISHPTMSAIIAGRRPISVETALRLARYFTTTAEFWLNLQSDFDLRMARRKLGEMIEREVKPCQGIAA